MTPKVIIGGEKHGESSKGSLMGQEVEYIA